MLCVNDGFSEARDVGLVSQIRRACVSIAANIAEGCGRKGDGEFHRFLNMAMGSASEVEYHLLLSRDLKFVNNSDYQRLDTQVTEIKRMLASLTKKVSFDRTV